MEEIKIEQEKEERNAQNEENQERMSFYKKENERLI
jgi:hypothetical protein